MVASSVVLLSCRLLVVSQPGPPACLPHVSRPLPCVCVCVCVCVYVYVYVCVRVCMGLMMWGCHIVDAPVCEHFVAIDTCSLREPSPCRPWL